MFRKKPLIVYDLFPDTRFGPSCAIIKESQQLQREVYPDC
jgi:hypothetical protein